MACCSRFSATHIHEPSSIGRCQRPGRDCTILSYTLGCSNCIKVSPDLRSISIRTWCFRRHLRKSLRMCCPSCHNEETVLALTFKISIYHSQLPKPFAPTHTHTYIYIYIKKRHLTMIYSLPYKPCPCGTRGLEIHRCLRAPQPSVIRVTG